MKSSIGTPSFGVFQKPTTTNVNMNLQRSQNQIFTALRSTQGIFNQQLGQFEKVISRSIQLTKKELTQEIEKERGFIKKLNNYDNTQILQLKKRMEETKRRNNQILRKVLNFQQLIISIATHQGMLDLNAVSIERQSEIYRNSNQIQRLEVEMQRQIFDLQSDSNDNRVSKEQKYDTSILKGFEQAVSAVAMEVLDYKNDLIKQINSRDKNKKSNSVDRSRHVYHQNRNEY